MIIVMQQKIALIKTLLATNEVLSPISFLLSLDRLEDVFIYLDEISSSVDINQIETDGLKPVHYLLMADAPKESKKALLVKFMALGENFDADFPLIKFCLVNQLAEEILMLIELHPALETDVSIFLPSIILLGTKLNHQRLLDKAETLAKV